jgi:hypothetical protein
MDGHTRLSCDCRQGAQCLAWHRLPQRLSGARLTTIAIDAYILDTLMRDLVGHDRRPSAFLVYLYLWRTTHGRGEATAQVALLDIAQDVGLSKRSVQEALSWLAKRKLVTVARRSITAVPVYTVLRPWRR